MYDNSKTSALGYVGVDVYERFGVVAGYVTDVEKTRESSIQIHFRFLERDRHTASVQLIEEVPEVIRIAEPLEVFVQPLAIDTRNEERPWFPQTKYRQVLKS